MKPRSIQPHRKDLLINTEWGLPKEDLPNKDAKRQGLKLYKKYWVTKDEKKRLAAEYNAYRSIYLLSRLLIFISFLFFLSEFSAPMSPNYFKLIISSLLITGSIGLIRYQAWGRNILTMACAAMIFLPFLPGYVPDKVEPVLWWALSFISLHALYNKKARQIFSEPKETDR